MIDPLSIFANTFVNRTLNFLARIIKDFNNKRGNKRIFKNWIDYYRSKNIRERD